MVDLQRRADGTEHRGRCAARVVAVRAGLSPCGGGGAVVDATVGAGSDGDAGPASDAAAAAAAAAASALRPVVEAG